MKTATITGLALLGLCVAVAGCGTRAHDVPLATSRRPR